MNDDLETGKKTTKADEGFVAPETGEIASQPEQSEQVDQPEFELTPEIEAENLEKGKTIAMEKVVDIQEDLFGISGTQLVNMENLILHGPDASKRKTGYWDKDLNHAGGFYFEINKVKDHIGGDYHNPYPISMIMDRGVLKRIFSDKKWYDERWLDSQAHETSLDKAPPEVFQGILITDRPYDQPSKELSLRNLKHLLGSTRIKDDEKVAASQQFVNKYVSLKMIKIAKENPERTLPVYNMKGDLLWPKQMSYEEVKDYVAGREKKKDKTNDNQAGLF